MRRDSSKEQASDVPLRYRFKDFVPEYFAAIRARFNIDAQQYSVANC